MTHSRRTLLICVLLAVATVAVYVRMSRHEFVNFDDPDYIGHTHVKAGWTWRGFGWAFTTGFHRHWHPVTWLSHMTDCQLFGVEAGAHHMVSLAFHVAATLALFALLSQSTGAPWRSAFVAALFALHPLHVEPVAWVAGRKDLLCGLFYFLTIWAYVWYCRRPGVLRYALVVALFALALMAKSMAVTLPVVLLLLDYWPLRRLWPEPVAQEEEPKRKQKKQKPAPAEEVILVPEVSLRRIVAEKAPLLVMAALCAFLATRVIHTASVVDALQAKARPASRIQQAGLPNPVSALNASRFRSMTVNYTAGLGSALWPRCVPVSYRGNDYRQAQEVLGGAVILILISAAVVLWGRRARYLVTGWLWYLLTLLPVVGVMQLAGAGVADRYTYIPHTGLFIMVAWGVPDLLAGNLRRRVALGVGAAVLLVGCAWGSWLQLCHWQDSVALMQYTIDMGAGNHITFNDLGNALKAQGKMDLAMAHYRRALTIHPRYHKTYNNIGNAFLGEMGRPEHSLQYYRKALKLQPRYAIGRLNFAVALLHLKRVDEAIRQLRLSIEADPDGFKAHYRLAVVLMQKERFVEAEPCFERAVELDPNSAPAREGLAKVREQLRRSGGALRK